ncbi:MAG: HipA domain-containing protein [Verrucomicrobiae bacterium]|nr:HipA domain-containing protein [Verrucomicrobiae bacterium]
MPKAEKSRDIIEVILDAPELGELQKVGWLYRPGVRTDLPASFEYEPGWRESDRAFMLDPRLELWSGEQHPPARAAAFGIFMDSAPDRWGRVLMERREAVAAHHESRQARHLRELDFLLGVHDMTRMGALRLRRPNGPFLDDSLNAVPPVTGLQELAYISQRMGESGVEGLPEYEKWLATLIAPGSSLGGARPKASFSESNGRIWIAKFPARDDRYDVGGWEYLVHRLAHRAGIWVPEARQASLTPVHSTFCVERFDRRDKGRRLYTSAMTLLEYEERVTGAGYLEIAEFISDHGAQGHIDEDLKQLYRRVVFNVLIGNRDDHLRNHGFIREPSGWRLSPAFDMNPHPGKTEHVLTLDGSSRAPDMAAVLRTADLYRLSPAEAMDIVQLTKEVVATWRVMAKQMGLPRSEIQRMEPVFQV